MTPEGWAEYWKERALAAEERIEDLKDFGRAKSQLIRDLGWTEPAAHRHIQKTAMDTQRSMGAVAREILAAGAVNHGA